MSWYGRGVCVCGGGGVSNGCRCGILPVHSIISISALRLITSCGAASGSTETCNSLVVPLRAAAATAAPSDDEEANLMREEDEVVLFASIATSREKEKEYDQSYRGEAAG